MFPRLVSSLVSPFISSSLGLFQNNLLALKYVGSAGPKKWEHSTILNLLLSETEIMAQYFSPDIMHRTNLLIQGSSCLKYWKMFIFGPNISMKLHNNCQEKKLLILYLCITTKIFTHTVLHLQMVSHI